MGIAGDEAASRSACEGTEAEAKKPAVMCSYTGGTPVVSESCTGSLACDSVDLSGTVASVDEASCNAKSVTGTPGVPEKTCVYTPFEAKIPEVPFIAGTSEVPASCSCDSADWTATDDAACTSYSKTGKDAAGDACYWGVPKVPVAAASASASTPA